MLAVHPAKRDAARSGADVQPCLPKSLAVERLGHTLTHPVKCFERRLGVRVYVGRGVNCGCIFAKNAVAVL